MGFGNCVICGTGQLVVIQRTGIFVGRRGRSRRKDKLLYGTEGVADGES